MAKKAARTTKGRNTPSRKSAGAGRVAAARSGAGAGRKTARNTGRKTAGAKTPRGKAARKSEKNPPRPGKQKKAAARKTAQPARSAGGRKTGTAKSTATGSAKSAAGKKGAAKKTSQRRAGGTGRERDLDQTPQTGRSVRGRTNPMPTKRSTGTPGGAGDTRRTPALERERKQLRELEESVPQPPSSLDMDRHPSAARSGRAAIRHATHERTHTRPAMTGGDVDADWEDAYAVGDEAPGGDNPTPDQDVVDDIGRALGVEYQDNEELKAADKIAERDRHRWELDPASAEDYKEHNHVEDEEEE